MNIIRCNNFVYFASLTFDNQVIDYDNLNIIIKKTQYFFKEFSRNNQNIYLYIPEIGPNGRIHIHAVLAGDFPLECIGVDNHQHAVYKLTQWHFGYSIVKEIYNKNSLVYYLTKGIIANCQKIFKRFYYAGGKNLIRQPIVENCNIQYDMVIAKEYISPYNSDFKYKYINF